MARRVVRIFRAIAIAAVVLLVPLALIVSHDAPCGSAPALAPGATTMKGMAYRCYGSPDVLKLEELEKPVAADDEVLVKVRAASVNPLDWHYLRGKPYLVRLSAGLGTPKNPRLGVDFAGTIEAVGRNVTAFRPGDEVFGGKTGAFAEYVAVRADRALARKPANVSFEQAASLPIAASTALQAVRDRGHVHAGQKVLINGASGGVGTFAVQIAKSFGAEVTGVCSTRNLDLVRSIGADHVVDYTKEDFTTATARYDVIIDLAGTHGLLDYRRVLTADGVYVGAGSVDVGNWLGPLATPIFALMLNPFVSQKFGVMLAQLKPDDLAILGNLMESGKLTPVIDRTYRLSEVPDALRYLEQGHARGKVVIVVAEARENPTQ